MPAEHTNNPTDAGLRDILESARTIAIVGASDKVDRPSHGIMKILMAAGYNCIPVNPRETTVLGKKAYKALADIPVPVDIVDVFRRAEETPAIAREAVAIRAKVLWLQLGISNEEAAAIARAGGLKVVMDRCAGQTVMRLGIKRGARRDPVDEAGRESFPASDPPSWSTLISGAPEEE